MYFELDPVLATLSNKDLPDVLLVPYKTHTSTNESGQELLLTSDKERVQLKITGKYNLQNISAAKEALSDAKPFKNDKIGKDIPAILLEVTTVDKDNLLTTVVKDGYATFDEVYKNVPADQRPKQ